MCFVVGMTVVVAYIPCIVVWPPILGHESTWSWHATRHSYFCLQNDVYLYALQRVIPRTFALLYTKGNRIGHLGQPMQNSVISQETKSS